MNEFVLTVICLIFVCLSNSQGSIQSIIESTKCNNDWCGESWFKNNYLFKWKTDDINKQVIMRIEVQSKGWVGFGFSKHGQTQEVDLVIGWVDQMGHTTFKASVNKFIFHVYMKKIYTISKN